MNIQEPLQLLGGLSPQVFMQRHWEKKPLLIRQAIPGFQPILDRSCAACHHAGGGATLDPRGKPPQWWPEYFSNAAGHWLMSWQDVLPAAWQDVLPAMSFAPMATVSAMIQARMKADMRAVVGLPDDRYGEAVHAVLTLRAPATRRSDLLDCCRASLANYKVPKSFRVIDSFALLPNGKIDRVGTRAAASLLTTLGCPQWIAHSKVDYVRIAKTPADINAVRIAAGEADLVLGCDMVVVNDYWALSKIRADRSEVVLNTYEAMPGSFTRNTDMQFPANDIVAAIKTALGNRDPMLVDANELAMALIGDAIATNLFMLGYAWQQGLVPISHEALMRAIELNGVAVTASVDDKNDLSALLPTPLSPLATSPLRCRGDIQLGYRRHQISMQSSDIAARYTFARQLAREAGEFAHTYFGRLDEITVESKGTQDEVSVADRDTEAFIRQRIGEAFPGDGILGEEGGDDRAGLGFAVVEEGNTVGEQPAPLTVGPVDADHAGAGLAAGDGLHGRQLGRLDRHALLVHVGKERREYVPAGQVGRREAEDALGRGVVHEDVAACVAHDDAFAHGGEQGAETVLAFAQFCLRIAAIRDVDAGPDVPRKLAPSVINGAARVDDPAVLAVTAAQAILHLKRSADGKMLQVGAHAAVEIVRVDTAGPAVAHLILQAGACEL